MSRILSTFFIIAFVIVLLTLTIGSKEVRANNSIITDFFALPLTNEPTVILHWTSSGDFSTIGYEVGYSTLPISEDNWAHITKLTGAFHKAEDGNPAFGHIRIDNLNLSTMYYFAVKAYDNLGNYTALSNVVNITTTDSVKSWDYSNFDEMTGNSWWNLNPALPPGSTSQVFLGYDPVRDMLMTWGGHPAGGGYPQVDELYIYNIGNLSVENTWKIENINLTGSSDNPTTGCCTGGTYDETNKMMFKRGQHRVDSYEYYRKSNLEGWPWVYDFSQHKWFDMKTFHYSSQSNDGAGVCYDSNDQVVMILDPRHDNYYRTIIYDAYTNKVTRIPINAWTALGGTRSDMGLVYDSKRNRFVVVGGLQLGVESVLHHYTDVWTFNLTDKKWVEEEGITNSEILPTEGWGVSDAVYDSIHDKIILFLGYNVSGATKDGRYILAFAYDPDTKTWEKLNDKPGYFMGHRSMDLNAIFSNQHNAALVLDSASSGMSGGVLTETWAYRYSADIPAKNVPDSPENIFLETTENSAIIKWDLSSHDITNYNIYRAQAEDSWDAEYVKINTLPFTAKSYTDATAISGKIYFYYVTAVDSQDRESNPSMKVRTQPRVVREGHVVLLSNSQEKIYWTSREEDNDVVGYNIYRRECDFETYPLNQTLNTAGALDNYTRPTVKFVDESGAGYWNAPWHINDKEGDYVKINSDLITVNEYTDNINLVNESPDAVYPYKVYAYRVKAVNRFGVESGWSPFWLTIPDTVTGLKMSKDENNYYLSWIPLNNGEGIKGYRIFSTYGAHGIKEITDELTENNSIHQTSAIIPKAIDLGRWQRFYVTATDNLNQEGIPSAGIWGDRIYWESYKQYFGLSIASSFLPDGTVGQDYNTRLQVANGTPPYQWRLVSGSLPEEVYISYDGNISGTPSKAGSYTFKVAVSDSSSIAQEVIKEFSLQVENSAIAIVPTPPEDDGETPPEDDGDVEEDEIRGDLDGDGDIDRNDLNILLSYRDQPASACIACDLDGDGTITVLDARKLVVMCTRPRCSCE